MSGRITAGTAAAPPEQHDHVVLTLDDGTVVRFNDPRRFGLLDYSCAAGGGASAARGARPRAAGAGFRRRLSEPRARRQADADQVGAARPADRRRARQHLCLRGVVPRRHFAAAAGRDESSGSRAERLAAAIREVLTEAIEAGGSSLRDYVQANGELGYFQHRWAVYGKEGEPCPGCNCAEGVRRIVQSGRSTFFCAKRQR